MTPTLKVNTELDGAGMIRGMNQIQGNVKNWSGAIKGYVASAFSVGAITQLGRSTADYFAGVGDSAERLDVAVDKLQALVHVAKLAGKEIGDVERLLNSISNAQVEAITNPDSQAAKSFASMGMSRSQLDNMGISEVVQRMAQSLQGLSLGQARGSTEGILKSKDVGIFMSMSESVANLTSVTAQLVKDGKITSEANIAALKKQQDSLEVQWSILKTTILPAVIFVLKIINTIVISVSNMMRTVKELFGAFSFRGLFPKPGQPLGNPFPQIIDKIAAENYRQVLDIWSGKTPKRESEQPPNLTIRDTFQDVLDQMRSDLQFFQDKASALSQQQQYFRGSIPGVPMSNFLGQNLGLIDRMSRNSTDLLKQIAKNTSYIKNIQLDAKEMFGVTL